MIQVGRSQVLINLAFGYIAENATRSDKDCIRT